MLRFFCPWASRFRLPSRQSGTMNPWGGNRHCAPSASPPPTTRVSVDGRGLRSSGPQRQHHADSPAAVGTTGTLQGANRSGAAPLILRHITTASTTWSWRSSSSTNPGSGPTNNSDRPPDEQRLSASERRRHFLSMVCLTLACEPSCAPFAWPSNQARTAPDSAGHFSTT